jgi:hypothetical protein
VSWPVTAAGLFGQPTQTMTGQDVGNVLLTGPGQRQLARRALTQAAAGLLFSATVAGGNLGEGRYAMRFESLTGTGNTLVIAQRITADATWLSQAAGRIGTSLDLFQTAREVIDAAVPVFADAAAIYVAERLLAAEELTTASSSRGVVVRRLAGRMTGKDAALHKTLLQPGEVLALGSSSPVAHAMTTGQPVTLDHLDSETTERIGKSPGGPQAAASYASFLAAPLTASGLVVGCLVFGREPASPAFTPPDIAQGSELASRAAVCIDNARLYQRERRTALALQQAFLPGQPAAPAGIEVAHQFRPVGTSVIGGDWHDIISLPAGKTVLIVGDAMGHGPEAAAVMVQLRTAAHTLARLGLPPEQLLEHLDRFAADMDAATFATCIVAVIEPAASTCLLAQAGHVPPVLALPHDTQVLDLPPGLPLGLGSGSFQATAINLPPGATLALCTDGLVESRARPLGEGLAALRDALAAAISPPAATLSNACETIIDRLRGPGEDDATLLLAHTHQ